jgi:hypothetical protein
LSSCDLGFFLFKSTLSLLQGSLELLFFQFKAATDLFGLANTSASVGKL